MVWFLKRLLIIWGLMSIQILSSVRIDSGLGRYTGSTSYSIGGITESEFSQVVFHFPVSKLAFPLSVDVMEHSVICCASSETIM